MTGKFAGPALLESPGGQIFLSGLIGLALFLLFIGPAALLPTNIGWLQYADGEQHYLGWAVYRHEPWSFPPGRSIWYGLGIGGSIVYADALPLLAIPFKILSPILPEPFQYYGLWILACYVLQAIFACRLAGLFTANPAYRLLAAALIATAPVMLWRLHPFIRHESLMAHFLILWALWLCLKPIGPRHLAGWSALLAAATLIHAYLLAMVLALFIADVLDRMRVREVRLRGAAAWLGAGVTAVLLPAWLAGYFEIGGDVSAAHFGAYGIMGDGTFLQLPLTFLKSDWADYGAWSQILPEIPVNYSHHEGYLFLGTGIIICLVCALLLRPIAFVPNLPFLRRHLVTALAIAGLTFFAIIKIGTLIAIEKALSFVPAGAEIYDALFRFGSMFRANGRFAWPLYYLVMLLPLVALAQLRRPAMAVAILAGALAVQIVDASQGWGVIRNSVSIEPRTRFETRLKDPFWEEAAAHYQTIRRLPPKNQPGRWRDIADLAARHRVGTDVVYLSRSDQTGLEAGRIETLSDLERSIADDTALYIIGKELPLVFRQALAGREGFFATVDGMTVYAPGWNER